MKKVVFIHLGDKTVTIYIHTKVKMPKIPFFLNSSVLLLI